VKLLLERGACVDPQLADSDQQNPVEHFTNKELRSPLQKAIALSREVKHYITDCMNSYGDGIHMIQNMQKDVEDYINIYRDSFRMVQNMQKDVEEMIQLLLKQGANVKVLLQENPKYREGCRECSGYSGIFHPALHYITDRDNQANALTILCTMWENNFRTPLTHQQTTNPAANLNGESALHLACLSCDDHLIKTLLDKGADVTVTNGNGMTPLIAMFVYRIHWTRGLRQEKQMRMILEKQMRMILVMLKQRGVDVYNEECKLKGWYPTDIMTRGEIILQMLLDD
jgi:hypothetical protein